MHAAVLIIMSQLFTSMYLNKKQNTVSPGHFLCRLKTRQKVSGDQEMSQSHTADQDQA